MKGFDKQNKFFKKKKSEFETNKSNTKILNQALLFQSQGNISEAKKPMPDHEKFKNEENKFDKYFEENI